MAQAAAEEPKAAAVKLSAALKTLLDGRGASVPAIAEDAPESPRRGITDCGRWVFRYDESGAFFARPLTRS